MLPNHPINPPSDVSEAQSLSRAPGPADDAQRAVTTIEHACNLLSEGTNQITDGKQIGELELELDQLANALVDRFEDLSFIHSLTQRLTDGLTLLETPATIVNTLLEELAPCLKCQTLAIRLQTEDIDDPKQSVRDSSSSDGSAANIFCSIGGEIDRSGFDKISSLSRAQTKSVTGGEATAALSNELNLPSGEIVRAATVTVERCNVKLGEMIAIRSIDQPEFGTIQIDMMTTTSTMLAGHLINQRQYAQMQSMFRGMIQSLVYALEAKDSYTCGHSSRVAELSYELASRLGYDELKLANIRMGGLLHDIGKIGVDDSVLQKPGGLTDQEFEQIKQHPVIGYEILKGIKQFHSILPAVRHHHEAWNGQGYPDQLSGDEIPRDAQIMAVADAFDAMTSDRPYRSGMTREKVIAIFQDGRGKQWTPDVVDVLLQNMDELHSRLNSTEYLI